MFSRTGLKFGRLMVLSYVLVYHSGAVCAASVPVSAWACVRFDAFMCVTHASNQPDQNNHVKIFCAESHSGRGSPLNFITRSINWVSWAMNSFFASLYMFLPCFSGLVFIYKNRQTDKSLFNTNVKLPQPAHRKYFFFCLIHKKKKQFQIGITRVRVRIRGCYVIVRIYGSITDRLTTQFIWHAVYLFQQYLTRHFNFHYFCLLFFPAVRFGCNY